MTKRKIKPPAPWIAPGVQVHYNPIIGREHDGKVYTVRKDGGPLLLGGHTWVVWLDEKSGCVACDAVSQAAPQPAHVDPRPTIAPGKVRLCDNCGMPYRPHPDGLCDGCHDDADASGDE